MARRKNSAKGKPLSPAQIRGAEARYLMNTYRRPAVVFTHGRGCRLYDSTGREYLDFLGGIAVNALGHAHPRLVRVIRREAGRAIHVSNLFQNPYQAPLARKLVEWSGLDRVFFSNSGTEAIDGALKLALKRRPAVLHRKLASLRWKILFTAARLARFPSRIPQSTASRSRRSFPALNSCASTMSPISKPNSTAPSAR